MQDNSRFAKILTIPEFDQPALKEAERIFLTYKNQGTVLYGDFDSQEWKLFDEYASLTISFDFDRDLYVKNYSDVFALSYNDFVLFLKTYIIYRFGILQFQSLRDIVYFLKRLISFPPEGLDELEIVANEHIYRVNEFLSMLPSNDRIEELIGTLEEMDDKAFDTAKAKRELASFDSYFLFNDLLSLYWEQETDMQRKLFYFPVWLWWHITAILPTRPREFVLTPHNVITQKDGKYIINLRKSKIKGRNKKKTYRISEDYRIVSYEITEKLAKEILWYLDATSDLPENDLHTLFSTDIHYSRWQRSAALRNRYYTYTNLVTALKCFYSEIISEMFGYEIVYDRGEKRLRTNEIDFLYLGDTRHIALINMILEGATPTIAMILAGHDDILTTMHYYTNVAKLVESKTYRMAKRLKSGKQDYQIDTNRCALPMNPEESIWLSDNEQCTNPKRIRGDFSDCFLIMDGGQIGRCGSRCPYYRCSDPEYDHGEALSKQLNNEYKNLYRIIERVRNGENSESEDLTEALLKVKNAKNVYQRYLLSKEEKNNEEENV